MPRPTPPSTRWIGWARLQAPVLGLYGGQDTGIPNDTVEHACRTRWRSRRRIPKAPRSSEFVLYRDAPHAFHADYRPSYREASTPRTAGSAAWPGSGCLQAPKILCYSASFTAREW
jgi:dienelactone hydrolase